MAEPKKRGDGYFHQIQVGGQRLNGTFSTKAEARAWEAEERKKAKGVKDGSTQASSKKHKLSSAIEKYVAEVSVLKASDAPIREGHRLNAFLSYMVENKGPGVFIEDITSEDIAGWVVDRLEEVEGSTVRREWNIYSDMFTTAVRTWKWLKVNPFKDVDRPEPNAPRNQVWRWQEIKKIIRIGDEVGGKTGESAKLFRISLHTATRLKEAIQVPATFKKNTGVFELLKRKEAKGTTVRPIEVPTLTRSRRVIASMPKEFSVGPNEASKLFCYLKEKAGITRDVRFHDARATALTLMSKRMKVERLARISRHKDINILINTYYRETASEIARDL